MSAKKRSTLFELLGKLPSRFQLHLAREICGDDEDDECLMFTACIFENPPEGGWPSRRAYFGGHGGPKEWTPGDVECPPQYRYERSVQVGISAHTAESSERLTLAMLESFLQKVGAPGDTPFIQT